MINHALIEPALLAWLNAMGLQAHMRNKAEPDIRRHDGGDATKIINAIGSVKIMSTVALGTDEVRTTVNDDDATLLDPVVTGPRVMTVSCQVKAVNANAPHAYSIAERARTRLRLPTTVAAFKVAGIALADTESVVDISYDDDDGRLIGLANFDFTLNVAAAESDSTQDTIGTVELTSSWTGPDGNPLPAEMQLDEEPIEIDP